MNFFCRIAAYVLAEKPTAEMPEIAVQGLQEGIESPSLIILAGTQGGESPFVIDENFSKLLQELNITFILEKRQAAMFMAKCVAFDIINNTMDAYEGCKTLFNEIVDFLDVEEKAGTYAFEGIGLHQVYGDYVTIDDLRNATYSWMGTKTNEQLIDESKQSIKTELVKWLTMR
jgi:hypothetical protein